MRQCDIVIYYKKRKKKKNPSLWKWTSTQYHKDATWYLQSNLAPNNAEKLLFQFCKVKICKIDVHIFINKIFKCKSKYYMYIIQSFFSIIVTFSFSQSLP